MPARRPIQILSETVIHKIAAGEVVERPVSVVKELVENSLDAGATSIRIEVEQGGLQGLSVTDDGHGIPAKELPLALTRHATSKIERAEDLFALRTLGFRGEALASIASVSDFRIESATEATAPQGYAVEVMRNQTSGLLETAQPRGTRIKVDNLFCTTPARLKFMKRPETEWSHIYDLIVALALSHLEVQWELSNNGKRALFCPAATEAKTRVHDILGKDIADTLYPLNREVASIHLHGLIGHPNFSRKTNRNLFVFVNGRYVQDKLLQHAILTGYRGLLMTQQYPVVILYLDLDPDHVDVNVHPTKREVRFANSNAIHHLISETIRHALDHAPWRDAHSAAEPLERHAMADEPPVTEHLFARRPQEDPRDGVRQAMENYFARQGSSPDTARFENSTSRPVARIGTLAFSELQLIGQFNQTYLICANGESLVLIDQHAAHERIGFEQLKRSCMDGKIAEQRLLHPFTFDLGEADAIALKSAIPELGKLGFEVEEFGEKSFVLKSHPAVLDGCDWLKLLKEVAAEIQEEGRQSSVHERFEHVLATMACHRQIRAGDALKREEMLELLKQLEGTPRSYHCPHGRPVMVEVESREIERWFKRVL